jgi:hypothetical protein
MAKNGNLSYSFWMINYLELVAALIWIFTGLYAIKYSPGGTIFYLYAMPTGIWAGGIPLIIGIFVLIVNLVKLEKIQIAIKNQGEVSIDSFRLLKRSISLQKDQIVLTQLGLTARNHRRWLVLGLIFLIIFDVHLLIGEDLHPYSPVGVYLFLCGIIALIGAIIYYIAWHYQFRIIYRTKTNVSSELFEIILNLPMKKYHHYYDLFSILSKTTDDSPKCSEYMVPTSPEIMNLIGVLFITIGLFASLSLEYYLGEFTGILCWILGLYLMSYAIHHRKNLLSYHPSLIGEKAENGRLQIFNSIHFKYHSILESVGLFYLLIQSIKYLFHWYWFSSAGFNPVLFIAALVLFVLVFIRLNQSKYITKIAIGNRWLSILREYGSLLPIHSIFKNKYKDFVFNSLFILFAFIVTFVLYYYKLYYYIL